jgi:RNA polymerase sigma factor (TIGR02999 family)
VKRGGLRVRVPLTDVFSAASTDSDELLALDSALDDLARHNDRMARIVECRFFAGLSVAETAEALRTSTRTIEREWTRARAWLQVAMAAHTNGATVAGGKR